ASAKSPVIFEWRVLFFMRRPFLALNGRTTSSPDRGAIASVTQHANPAAGRCNCGFGGRARRREKETKLPLSPEGGWCHRRHSANHRPSVSPRDDGEAARPAADRARRG